MDSGKLPEFFYEIFDASLPRLGAGNEAATIKALHMLRSAKPRQHDQDPGPRLRKRRSDRDVGAAHGGVDSGGG